MATECNMFLRIWLNDSVRDVLCDILDDETLCLLRLLSSGLARSISPVLFRTVYLTFRVESFSKRGRLETFSRVGHHVRDLHFSMPHDKSTYLPDLPGQDLDTSVWPWHPAKTTKAKVEESLRHPTQSEGLMRQWPPMFQAASNVFQFIRFFQYMPNLKGLTITTPNQDPQDLHRRSAVDFAISSVRIALDQVPLASFHRLSLNIHPGALVSLLPTHSFVNSPRSGRLFSRVKKLKITLLAWDFEKTSLSYFKLLDHYLRAFSESLEKFIFTWNGKRGPCPLSLLSSHTTGLPIAPCADHLLFGELTSLNSPLPKAPDKPNVCFRRLRRLHLENVSLTSQQLHDVLCWHKNTLRGYDFRRIELIDRGSFEYATSALAATECQTSRWPVPSANYCQSFNDSGYESRGSHDATLTNHDSSTNRWAGITDNDLYDDFTPGMEYKRDISNILAAVLITAKLEKRRVKRRRRLHPKEVVVGLSQHSDVQNVREIPSRIMFGASILSLGSLRMNEPPKLSSYSAHPRTLVPTVSSALYGALGDICLNHLSQPTTLHPASRVDTPPDVKDEEKSSVTLLANNSVPFLLQPNVYVPLRPVTYEPPTISIPLTKPDHARQSFALNPSVMTTKSARQSESSLVLISAVVAPSSYQSSSAWDRAYSPGDSEARLSPSSPRYQEQVYPSNMVLGSPFLSPTANSFRFDRNGPECTPCVKSDSSFPGVPSNTASTPYTVSRTSHLLDPSVFSVPIPRNPLEVAQHQSLIADPIHRDAVLQCGKEAIISNLAVQYKKSSLPAQAIKHGKRDIPLVREILGRTLSDKLVTFASCPFEAHKHAVSSRPSRKEDSVGRALKKGLRSFFAKRVPTAEIIPSPNATTRLGGVAAKTFQQPIQAEKCHERSKSDFTDSHVKSPRSPRDSNHMHTPTKVRGNHFTEQEPIDPFVHLRNHTQKPETNPHRTTVFPGTEHHPSTPPKLKPCPPHKSINPSNKPGHGIEEAYRELQAVRAEMRAADEARVRLAAAIERECLLRHCRVGDGDDELIDLNTAWGYSN